MKDIQIPHLSPSQLGTIERCERNWYLAKLKQAEEIPAWYTLVGSAVHNGIERKILDGVTQSAEDVFYPLVDAALLIEPDTALWAHSTGPNGPYVEDEATALVEACLEAAYAFLEDVTVYEVEYEATGTLPGCDVPIKSFIDVVGEHKKHGYVIIDWKTGKAKPKSNLQLETYAALLNTRDHPFNEHTGIQFNTGLWVMLSPEASKARPVDLSQVDVQALGQRYQAALIRMKRGIFPYRSEYSCRWCFQKPNCRLQSGNTDRAVYYDTVEKDGYLPI